MTASTYAVVRGRTIRRLAVCDSDFEAQQWFESLPYTARDGAVLVVLDLGDREVARIGDRVEVDADGVAVLVKAGAA